ncbi:MAG: acyltransferase [Solirubrobacterales bacterium]|nr:acyltransferase [Solirubrobacterales bacterium]
MEEERTHSGSIHHLSDPGKEARAKSGVPVVPVFDGYRALAILGIVMLHMLGYSGILEGGDTQWYAYLTWATIGHAVDILFIVSGFVVFLPTVARNGEFGSVGAYAIRRIARLYPAYWLVLLISMVLLATITVSPDLAFPGLRDLTFHTVGFQGVSGMFFPTGGGPIGFGINPPLWTLSVEVTFYIVLPLVASLYFRRPFVGLFLAALVTVGWNWSFEHIGQVTEFVGTETTGLTNLRLLVQSTLQFPSWAFSFACGMTGAWIFARVSRDPRLPEWRTRIRIAQVISLVGFIVLACLAGRYTARAPLQLVAEYSRLDPEIALGYSGFLAALMVTTALGPAWARVPFSNNPIRRLGDISYGIFLSHMIIAFYIGSALLSLPENGSLGNLLLWCVVVVPPAVLYGYVSARFLEQPIRRWARQFGRRAQPGSK